jgi:hypothetical protein
MSDARRYLANPDVSCREEEPEGALLFNPDTEAIMVVNSTGLLIWQVLDQPRTLDEIVAHLLEVCEDIPMDRVTADVSEFVQALESRGFIGVVLQGGAR